MANGALLSRWNTITLRLEMSEPAFPQRRILVVDDEPFVLEAVKMMLSFDGHTVTTVGDAKEALGVLESNEFDLVITDYAMPGMRGDELAARIKANKPAQPVVMITAYAEMLTGKSLPGVDFMISKPFLLENLREAIAKVAPPVSASAKHP
jgi:CheY-like chemotaxis protein